MLQISSDTESDVLETLKVAGGRERKESLSVLTEEIIHGHKSMCFGSQQLYIAFIR